MDDGYDRRLTIHGGGEEAVVLVPGMDGTGRLFHRQVPLLAKSYRVATYALRDATTSMDVLVADLASVIDVAAPATRRAIVIGESFGGTLALSLALAVPDRVSALVILNSFPYFVPQRHLHLARNGLKIMPWGAMGLLRRLTAFRLHSRHTERDEIRRFLELTSHARREGYLNRLKLLTSYDVRHRLQDLRCSTLFLAAELDHLVPSLAQAQYMAARVPGAALRVLQRQGHTCLIAPDIDLEQILTDWREERRE